MEEALKLLTELKGMTVLCVGDVMLDRYIYGQASRLSPEAPVPVVKVSRQLLMPGGVGNVVKNLGSLGARPLTVSVAGDDYEAGLLRTLLLEDGLPEPHLVRDAQRPTSVKTRIVAGIQQVVRFDEEDESPISESAASELLEAVRQSLPQAGALALSDYGKGVLSDELIRLIMDLAKAAGKPVVVDPKGADYSRYRGASLVTPNRAELAEAAGRRLKSAAEQRQAGLELMARCGLENLLITRSEEGVMLLSGDQEPVILPSQAVEVFDVSGAGDTVVAVMAACLAVGAPLAVGARLANLAAAVVVGKVGTATARPEEIIAGYQARLQGKGERHV